MKAPPRYNEKFAKDPSVQGNMSVEDIIKRDWERNYKGKAGITAQDLENVIRYHITKGGEIYRFRNTLFLVTPEDGGFDVIKMHSITGDIFELYITALLLFLATMNQTNGTEEVYTYTPDKVVYRKLKNIFSEFLDIEDARDDPDADANYKLVLDLAGYMQRIQAASQQQRG